MYIIVYVYLLNSLFLHTIYLFCGSQLGVVCVYVLLMFWATAYGFRITSKPNWFHIPELEAYTKESCVFKVVTFLKFWH